MKQFRYILFYLALLLYFGHSLTPHGHFRNDNTTKIVCNDSGPLSPFTIDIGYDHFSSLLKPSCELCEHTVPVMVAETLIYIAEVVKPQNTPPVHFPILGDFSTIVTCRPPPFLNS